VFTAMSAYTAAEAIDTDDLTLGQLLQHRASCAREPRT
jgi:hypothetical protein